MNRICIKGNLGKAPEDGITDNGKQWARFSVATSNDYHNGTEWVSREPDWHNVTVWGENNVKKVMNLDKGDPVFVDGSVHYRKHEEKFYTEIRAKTVFPIVRVKKSNPLPTDSEAPTYENRLAADNTIKRVEQSAPTNAAAGDDDLPF